jgi:hypothetical protein
MLRLRLQIDRGKSDGMESVSLYGTRPNGSIVSVGAQKEALSPSSGEGPSNRMPNDEVLLNCLRSGVETLTLSRLFPKR